ncbi:hypothetical protein [Diaphorobacter caeni]|uniref:hypothetical protein n=1 Tax=Diaphorobacter caeni TaxID=2784387 RepID=UPI00189007A7|nr:hypothetical protein [Diaphorobacter caeni]MBF5006640.1 hypothetical protein [Diaphorobacter caeni]
MAQVFICQVSESPCQLVNQVLLTDVTVEQLAEMGISAASLAQATTLGFGLVFFLAVAGLVAGWIVRLIRTI